MKYLDLGLSDMHKAFLQMRLVCLLMIILPGTLWAQNTKISGQVIDDTGEPVIGATVRLKGAMTGTVTDLTGGFVLQVSDMKGILEFSFVGMETLEVPIKGKTKSDDEIFQSAIGRGTSGGIRHTEENNSDGFG